MTSATLAIILAIVGGLFILLGFIGVFTPALPGVPLAWIGFVAYAWGTGFERISLTTTIVFSAIALVITILDLVIQYLGAKKFDASKAGLIGITIGLITGLFWPPIGTILFPVLGAYIGELITQQDFKKAIKPALGSLVGFLCGTFMKAVFIIVMAVFFIIALF